VRGCITAAASRLQGVPASAFRRRPPKPGPRHGTMDAAVAQKAFEAANQIRTTNDPSLSLERLRESDDALFRYDEKDMMQLLKDKPWKQK